MSAVGGPIQEVSLNGRIFPVAADADVTRKVGGFENEHSPNGDGSGRTLKTRVGWSVTGFQLELDDARGDHEFLQDLADLNTNYACAITYVSGAVWQGTGQIVGELTGSSQNATGAVGLAGPGKLVQQA